MKLFAKQTENHQAKQTRLPAFLEPKNLLTLLIVLLCSAALIALCAFGGYHLTKHALATGRIPSGEEITTPGEETTTEAPELTTETTTEAPEVTTEAPEPLQGAELFLQNVSETFFADLQTEIDFMRLKKWSDGGFDSPDDLSPRSILNMAVAQGELRAQLEEEVRVRLAVDDLNAFAEKRFGITVTGKEVVKAINNDQAIYLEKDTLVLTKKAVSWPDEDWVLENYTTATAGDYLVVNLTRAYASGTRTSQTVTLQIENDNYRYVSLVDESQLLSGTGEYESGSSGETGMSKVNERRKEYYTYFQNNPNLVRAPFSYPENANGLAVFALLNCGQDTTQGVSPDALNAVLAKYFETGLADWNTDYTTVDNGLVYAKDNVTFSGTNRLVLDKFSEKSGVTKATFHVYHFDGAVPAEADEALSQGNTDGYRKAGTWVISLKPSADGYIFTALEPTGLTVVKKPEVKEPTVTLDTGNFTVGSVALGMDYETASALLGDPDQAPALEEGKMIFVKNGVEYTFCQIDDSYSAAYDSLRDGRFYLLKMRTLTSSDKFVLGLKVGSSLQDALSALGCPDAKLQMWAEQSLYNRKSGSATLYYTLKTASYHIIVNAGDTHLRIDFDKDQLVTAMNLTLAP